TAARFYARAFAAGARSVSKPPRPDRFDAACSAALAAAGRTADADGLDDARRAALRQQALGWLKADLKELELKSASDRAKARPAVQAVLRRWQRVADLASVRDAEALARLPEAEARAWRDFWKRVTVQLTR